MTYNCDYCDDGPHHDWVSLAQHLKDCQRKRWVDINRDEYKKAYGFFPSFDTVKGWMDEVRGFDEKDLSPDDEEK